LISGLYPALAQVNTFTGCIRNVLSDGYYLDMYSPLSSVNSNPGPCPCTLTNSCTSTSLARSADIIIPWYTWLIIALRRRQQQKTLAGLYPDDTRDNIIDYK
jgi:hypothetical protein